MGSLGLRMNYYLCPNSYIILITLLYYKLKCTKLQNSVKVLPQREEEKTDLGGDWLGFRQRI